MHEGIPRDGRPTVKVILVGNSGVGKTCLMNAFTKQQFDSKTSPTVAPAYSYHEVKKSDGTKVVLQIWDTAGQERYSSISQLFFRDSDVALVCCDPQDEQSINAVVTWAQKVLDEVSTCHLFGVFTKSDLIDPESVDTVVENAKCQLHDINIEQFFVTSSVKRTGVDEVFNAAGEMWEGKSCPTRVQMNGNPVEGKTCC